MRGSVALSAALLALAAAPAPAQQAAPRGLAAIIDGSGPGWHGLAETHFMDVNGLPETWKWDGGLLRTTGEPIGVLCGREPLTNFELVAEWRHLRPGGNSGVFVWVPGEALEQLPPGSLPEAGIEVQMLDHGYRALYEARTGEKGDWFTTHGDVFAVGTSTLQPFPPVSPDGSRSFPRQERSRGVGDWNHYYVRAVNGEIRLWVNGVEVSGGTGAQPRSGHLCFEAEGAPAEFRNVRRRLLP